jgi:hypothetical protein
MSIFGHPRKLSLFLGGKKKSEDKPNLKAAYFFFLAFLSSFFGAFATLITSKLHLAPICI